MKRGEASPGGDRGHAGSKTAGSGVESDDIPIGPFPTWGRLYLTVLAYGIILIVILLLLTRLLDPGTP